MLRLILNKARSHFNNALEFAERDRNEEAIAELNNTLELDHTHVNSHVVLGTLYAKIGRMDRAADCWKEALVLDPRLEKAHEYLEKLSTGRRSLPVVRRQRLLIIAMVALLAVLGMQLAFQTVFKPRCGERLAEALAAFTNNNFARALDVIARFPEPAGPRGEAIALEAKHLEIIIRAEQKVALRKAQQHLDLLEVEQAHDEILSLLKRRPGPVVKKRALALRSRIVEAAQARVTAALDKFLAREIPEEIVRQALDVYGAVTGGGGADDFFATAERTLRVAARNQKIQDIGRRFDRREIDQWQRMEELMAIREEYPDYEKLQVTIDLMAGSMEKAWETRLESNLKAGELDQAGGAVGALRRLFQIVDPQHAADRVAPHENRLRKKRIASNIERLREAYRSADYEKVIALSGEIPAGELDATSRSVIERMTARASRKLADERWRWMKARDRKFIDGRISLDEAEKTIRYYPQVQKSLSRKVYRNPDDDLLFYLATAFRKIGQEEKSLDSLRRLKKEHPKSVYIKWVKKDLSR